jgi:hypothetical protein
MFNADKICEIHKIDPLKVLIPSYGQRLAVTNIEVITYLYLYDKEAKDKCGIKQPATFRKYIKVLFPKLNLRGLNNRSWSSWLLAELGFKKCHRCQTILEFGKFSLDKSTPDGFKYECKQCIHTRTFTEEYKLKQSEYNKTRYLEDLEYNIKVRRDHYYNNKALYKAYTAKRRAALLRAIPPWANLTKIKEIYLSCPEGYEVDHIYPLQGENTCGLHVETNLQYLTTFANRSKGNKLPTEGT